jgi:hypothetical protein
MLNLVPRGYDRNDIPAWEDGGIINTAINSWKNHIRFTGPVQRFAPLSRFIRIIDRQSMFFTNGLKASADAEDPMKLYLREDEKSPYQAVKLREDKAAWRDAHALFSLGSHVYKPPACLNHIARLFQDRAIQRERPRANLVGLATDKGKALLWRHERMPVPLSILGSSDLTERLGELLKNAEQAAYNLHNRIQRIAKLYLSPDAEEPNGRGPDEKDIADLIKMIDPRPAYWARLEEHFFALLENLPSDWDTSSDSWKSDSQQLATNTWRERVKEEARQALEESLRCLGTTARAVQAVARVRTDFNDDDLRPISKFGDAKRQKSRRRRDHK